MEEETPREDLMKNLQLKDDKEKKATEVRSQSLTMIDSSRFARWSKGTNCLKIYDVKTGIVLQNFPVAEIQNPTTYDINKFVLSGYHKIVKNSLFALSPLDPKKLCVWNLNNGKLEKEIDLKMTLSCFFILDNQLVGLSQLNSTLAAWNLQTGQSAYRQKLEQPLFHSVYGSVLGLICSKEISHLTNVTLLGNPPAYTQILHFFDMKTGEMLKTDNFEMCVNFIKGHLIRWKTTNDLKKSFKISYCDPETPIQAQKKSKGKSKNLKKKKS